MLALKRLPEKHTLIKLAAQTNKRTQILIQTAAVCRWVISLHLRRPVLDPPLAFMVEFHCRRLCQEHGDKSAKLQEELTESQNEVLHLNRLVAETNGKVNKLNTDIDGLQTAKEVKKLEFC